MTVLGWWHACQVRPEHVNEITRMADLCMKFKSIYYDPASAKTGIPWYVIAVIDMREEDFDHTGYLGNGDPLNRVTRDVPRGRGPFSSWADGAIDALTMDKFNRLPSGGHWDIVTTLWKLEDYNGVGYRNMGLPSPYVWALTNQQVEGKYTSDGSYDPNVWDQQPGCAGVLLTLKTKYSIDLSEQ